MSKPQSDEASPSRTDQPHPQIDPTRSVSQPAKPVQHERAVAVSERPSVAREKFESLTAHALKSSDQALASVGGSSSLVSNREPQTSGNDANDPSGREAISAQEELRSQTIIEALVALVTSWREETRSERILLISNIVLFFTVLFSPLASQTISSALKTFHWLWLPHPGTEVVFLWLCGMYFLARGFLSFLPTRRHGPEGMAGLRAKQAVESLADREVDQAIQKLKDAALEEYRLLEDLDKNRKWFWAAAIAFVLCLAVEFFTVVFLV